MHQAVARALAGRDGQGVTDALLACLDHGDERRAMVEALAGRDGQDVTDALLARLDDTDKGVRKALAGALAGRDGQDVTDALLALLHDRTTQVRQAAASALAGRKGQDVTDALLARLDDPDESTRLIATGALGGRDSPLDLQALAQSAQRVTAENSHYVLSAMYRLVTRHYQGLSAETQEMIRSTMSHFTESRPAAWCMKTDRPRPRRT